MTAGSPPDIFDRRIRRIRRDRAARMFGDHAFLIDYMIESLIERLDTVSRPFTRALDLGCHDGRLGRILQARGIEVISADAGFSFAQQASGIQCDEDRLPFADGSFDLVMSAGVLDQVNDLPGALSLIRRVLRPDGLMLAAFIGAGSLATLRAAMMDADIAMGGAAARIHPQIDVRAAGDLLGRAGFALPMADSERIDVRYANPLRLIADLRGMGATSLLSSAPPFNRARLNVLMHALADRADAEGAIAESFEIIFMTGWAPAPSQPSPARRGSGRQSLADILKPPLKD